MFPSDHFLLLPKPSGSPSDLLAAATGTNFFWPTFPASSSPAGNFRFRGARGRSTRRRKPRRQTIAHAPIFYDRLSFTRQCVWASDPLSGAAIPSPSSPGVVLLIHPFDCPPQAFLHFFGNFGSATPPSISFCLHQRQSPFVEFCVCLRKASSPSLVLFSTVRGIFLHLKFHNHNSPSY